VTDHTDDGTPPGYDPAATLRALAEAPRVGLEAAAAVIERILTLGRPGTASLPAIPWDGGNGGGRPGTADRRVQLRRARADAERVLDAYGDWARQLLDGVFGLAEGEPGAEVLVLGPVAPGATTEAHLWLHAPSGRVTAAADLRATTLTAHDGSEVAAGAITFDPPAVGPAGNGDGQAPSTRVTVSVPAGTAPGSYHGHVLAHGLPEIALAVRLEVVA
jgi:hypothetical protein